MNKPLILVAEDDSVIRNLIATTLEVHNYRFQIAPTGESAIMGTVSHNPDAILLDPELPDMDGIRMIQKVRTWSRTPILVISAKCRDSDKIEALDAGADDYLTKPFSVEELLARLRVALRRMDHAQAKTVTDYVFENGGLKIDYSAGFALLNDSELHLTPIEYRLLCLLSQNAGKVMTHNCLTNAIWGSSYNSDIASLRVFMAALRKKIEQDPANPRYIQTQVGVGYRMMKM